MIENREALYRDLIPENIHDRYEPRSNKNT